MSDFDWGKAIDQKFNASRNNLIETLGRIIDNVLLERADNVPGGESPFNDEDFSIPLPKLRISEAWGKMGTEDRAIIENYSKNIPGGTFEQKIESLNAILTEGVASGNISQIISTMVICEILSSILRDFTESAGGFIFEGFLAGLFGGKSIQIYTPEDIEGMDASGKPITDVILGDKHYSLKLLGPTTGVKGSFQNMVNHFKAVDHIVYLDARRINKDQGLEFLEFEITLENFVDVFVTPVLKQVTAGTEKGKLIRDIEKATDFQSALKQLVDAGKPIKTIAFDKVPRELGLSIKRLDYSPAIEEKRISGAAMDEAITAILEADPEVLQQYAPYGIAYADTKFEGTKAEKLFGSYGNVEKYARLMDSGDKQAALEHLSTLPGFTEQQQFEFTRQQADNIAGARSVGTLMIGDSYMKAAWSSYADSLSRTIGPVYQELKQFTDDLNRYVLGAGEGNETDRKQYAMDAVNDAKRLSAATENAVKQMEEK
jgi:hypothetical protein